MRFWMEGKEEKMNWKCGDRGEFCVCFQVLKQS